MVFVAQTQTREEKVDFGRMLPGHTASSASHPSLLRPSPGSSDLVPKQMELGSWGVPIALSPAIPLSPSPESSWEGLDPRGQGSSNHPSTAGLFILSLSCFSSSFTFPWRSQPFPLAAPWSPALHLHLARAELSPCPAALGLGF